MKNVYCRDMIEATGLIRAGQLGQATELLQRLLRGKSGDDPAGCPTRDPSSARAGNAPAIIDLTATTIEPTSRQPALRSGREIEPRTSSIDAGTTWQRPMPGPVHPWTARIKPDGAGRRLQGLLKPAAIPTADILPDGARFVAGSFGNQAGSRDYKLFIPSRYHGQTVPLLVMLHGCTQSPDDFAAGTRMNFFAEGQTCLVVYPEQPAGANASKCWNWFRPSDQQRGSGEPSLIADITRKVIRDYAVDRQRVYIAGLSAGGAAAAIMGTAYPDLYAAIGVHSGLACGAARDVTSAFAAMRQGKASAPARGTLAVERSGPIVPTIVFHGDQDKTVHPSNGDSIIAHSRTTAHMQAEVRRGRVPGGHAYTCTVHSDGSGRAILEQWDVHGAGHAWSGGSPAGTYTDPRGPDAAREMMRFFMEHRRQSVGQIREDR